MFILQIHSIDTCRPFSSFATTSSSAAKPSNHLFSSQSPSSTTSLTSPSHLSLSLSLCIYMYILAMAKVYHIYFAQSAESYELVEEACSPLPGFVELPTCHVCLGIPEAAEVAVPVAHLLANQATSEGVETRTAAAAPISGAPNSSPLNLFPQGCEREVAEAANGVSDELKSERIMRFSWALVHSKQPEDMQFGIAMLEDSLANSGSPLQKREKLYLVAVGYYRSAEYRRSRQLAEQCLEIAPDWMQALTLKKTVDDQITKDGVIEIGITATVVGLVAGGIATSLARKN